MASNTERYRAGRDHVFAMADDDRLASTFEWPRLVGAFNWATDWFDVIARGNDRTALRIVEEDGSEQSVSFAAMAERSDRVATWLEQLWVGKGDRVVLKESYENVEGQIILVLKDHMYKAAWDSGLTYKAKTTIISGNAIRRMP